MRGKCLTREKQTVQILGGLSQVSLSVFTFTPELSFYSSCMQTYMKEKVWAVLQSNTTERQEHYFTYDLKCCLRFLCRFLLELNSKSFVPFLFTCNEIVVSRETKQYWSLNFAWYCIFTMPNIHHHNKHCAHNTCSYNSWRTETNDNKSLIM